MTIPRKIRAYVEISTYPLEMGHAVLYAMTITNISMTGCFIKMDQGLEIGTPISFSLPLQEGKILNVRGTVAREQGEPHGYGISFDKLPEEERRVLALLIADSNEF
jgi:hypothetical protein